MSDQPDGRFRGRVSGQGQPSGSTGPTGPTGPTTGRAWSADWGWNPGADLRPRLPLFGVFLVIFGALLLVEQVVPGTRALGSGFTVAVGVALLIASVVNRRTWQLYAGAIVTAMSLPTLLQDLRVIHEGRRLGDAVPGRCPARDRAGAGGFPGRLGLATCRGGHPDVVGRDAGGRARMAGFPVP